MSTNVLLSLVKLGPEVKAMSVGHLIGLMKGIYWETFEWRFDLGNTQKKLLASGLQINQRLMLISAFRSWS